MELTERERSPKDRPETALTESRPELLADGSDDTFHRMVHDALVAGALVEKLSDPGDGRRLVLRTRGEAQSRLDRLDEVQRPVKYEHFAPLAHGDFEAFARLISELVDNADRALALLGAFDSRIASLVVVGRPTSAISAGESPPPN